MRDIVHTTGCAYYSCCGACPCGYGYGCGYGCGCDCGCACG